MFIKCFKEYCNFLGRSTRKEYWIYSIITWIINSILIGCIFPIFLMISNAGMISNTVTQEQFATYLIASPCMCLGIAVLIAIYLINIPIYAVSVRRLHDIGFSAWWLLINFIPIVGNIWFLVLMLLPGQAGSNQWGPNPREVPQAEINQISDASNYYKMSIKNYFNFSEKSSIEEFFGFNWTVNIVFMIIYFLGFLIGGICFGFSGIQSQTWMLVSFSAMSLMGLYCLFLIIPSIAIIIRRLRDAGYSPWFAILILASNIGQFVLYVMLYQPSKSEE